MSADEIKYVWAIEWENPFNHQNSSGMVIYDVTLLPGVTREDFEKFLAEEGLPAVEGILTRAIRFNQQYLLTHSEMSGPDPLKGIQREDVADKLASLCKLVVDNNLNVVMRSGANPGAVRASS